MNTNVESPWKTYPKALLLLVPVIWAWGFACVFLVPRLKELWEQADFADPTAHTILQVFLWLPAHWFGITVAIIALLALLEWRSRVWPQIRRWVVGTVVFILNFAIIFFLSALLTYALLVMSEK